MKLNRAHALFLVGTLAAGACTVDGDDSAGDAGAGGEAGDGSSGKGGTSAGSGAGKAGSGAGKAGSGASGEGGGGGSDSGGSAGANECGYAGESTDCQAAGAPGAGGAADAGGAAGAGGVESAGAGGEGGDAGAPSCDEEALPSTSCEGLAEYTCSSDEFRFDMCQVPAAIFKGYTADAVRNCLYALSDDELCGDARNVYECHRTALEAACPDPTAATDCDVIVEYCEGTVERDECEQYLSGMTVEGRYQMTACIESGSPASCDLWSCVEGLDYPSVE